MPADLVRENAGKEDANASAGEEDEGGDLGHDLVATDQVPLLDDRVLELAGVVVPFVTRNQLKMVTFALDKLDQALATVMVFMSFGIWDGLL